MWNHSWEVPTLQTFRSEVHTKQANLGQHAGNQTESTELNQWWTWSGLTHRRTAQQATPSKV